MIRVDVGPARTLHMFLSAFEYDQLEELAAGTHENWVYGRQESGYYKLDIKELIEQGLVDDQLDWLSLIGDRALDELRKFTGVNEFADHWDAYLLFYTNGSGTPVHTDLAKPGYKHVRLNAIVKAADGGGEFSFRKEEPGLSIGYTFRMGTEGEALIFSPSDYEHEVRECEGTRLVLSIGVQIPA